MIDTTTIIIIAVVLLIGVALMVLPKRERPHPLSSITLLRTMPRFLTEAEAREIYHRAVKQDFVFVTTRIPFSNVRVFGIKAEDLPLFAIYDGPDQVFNWSSVSEKSPLRKHAEAFAAAKRHTVCCHIMVLKKLPADPQKRSEAFAIIARIAAELCDEHVCLIVQTETDQFAFPSDRVHNALKNGRLAEIFSGGELAQPPAPTDSRDSRIQAAMIEAHRHLPELISAFARLGPSANPPVMFKARFVTGPQSDEYIWCRMTALESSHLIGINEDIPTNPSVPKKGETVRVARDDVVDWVYFLPNGKAKGFFVERIINPGVKNVLAN